MMSLLTMIRFHSALYLLVSAALMVSCAASGTVRPGYGIYHRVGRGETLYSISRAYDVEIQKIVSANELEDADRITAGALLFIPGARPRARLSSHRSAREDPDFMMPVEGEVTRGWGWEDGVAHRGLEISAPLGTPFKASAAGRVAFSGSMRGYGRVIIIEHEGDISTVYAHNQENWVSAGENVARGAAIGLVGASGRTGGGPGLYFEIRLDGDPVDPYFYLPR